MSGPSPFLCLCPKIYVWDVPAVGASHGAGSPLPSTPRWLHRRNTSLPTPSESYGLLLQMVIASRAPDKGTDGLEVSRVTVAETASGPRGNVHSKWIYFSARRSWFQEQDLPGDLRRRIQDLDPSFVGTTLTGVWDFYPEISSSSRRDQRHSVHLPGHFPITGENG